MRWSLTLATLMTTQLALLACGAGSAENADADTAAGGAVDQDSGDTPGLDTADSGDSGELASPPVWYALNAQLTLLDGQLESADFLIQVSGEDTDSPPNCVGERILSSASALEVSPDLDIYHWWSVETEADAGDCEGTESLPTAFYFGLGAIHVDLLPSLDRQDLSPETLYGAYASVDEAFCGGDNTTACVFGYAGTATNFSGESEAVAGAPLPDGVYDVRAAYYFPIE